MSWAETAKQWTLVRKSFGLLKGERSESILHGKPLQNIGAKKAGHPWKKRKIVYLKAAPTGSPSPQL